MSGMHMLSPNYETKTFLYIFLILWILPATGQRGLDLTGYIYESDYIVCGTIVSADTSYLLRTDPSKTQSVIVKMKIHSKLKGNIESDTIKIQYFPIDYWEHEDPPELQVDSLYLGFMKYNSEQDYFEPYLYDLLCFSSLNLIQIPYCATIVNGLLDDTQFDSCHFFKFLMEGVKADLLLTNRSLDNIFYVSADPQTSYCIDESTIDFLFKSFCRTHNTRLLNFTGNYHLEEIDSILISLITPRLISISESSDLYALDDKLAVYGYIEHLSFIKHNMEIKGQLVLLRDYISFGTHAEFTNLATDIISTKGK